MCSSSTHKDLYLVRVINNLRFSELIILLPTTQNHPDIESLKIIFAHSEGLSSHFQSGVNIIVLSFTNVLAS